MRILIIRQGAYGDNLIITPVIRHFSENGDEVHVLTSERGMEMFKNNQHIHKLHFIKEDADRPEDELKKFWKEKEEEIGAEKVINFTESIECNIALHPRSPRYNYTKEERREIANKNYYEESFRWARLEAWMPSMTAELNGRPLDVNEKFYGLYQPELFYTKEELKEASQYIKDDHFNVLVSLSGSGKNKAYPWIGSVLGESIKNIKDIHFITVGDEMCKLLEVTDDRITNLSGKIPIRISMALTGMVDLVVSPDTGLLHASGQYDTPKIGLLGHSSVENITKHFRNDYSIEADDRLAECAPCFRLIYNVSIQCPQDTVSHAAYCMSHGIPSQKIYERIKDVYHQRERTQAGNTVSA